MPVPLLRSLQSCARRFYRPWYVCILSVERPSRRVLIESHDDRAGSRSRCRFGAGNQFSFHNRGRISEIQRENDVLAEGDRRVSLSALVEFVDNFDVRAFAQDTFCSCIRRHLHQRHVVDHVVSECSRGYAVGVPIRSGRGGRLVLRQSGVSDARGRTKATRFHDCL